MDVTTALGAARADSPRGSTARARAGQADFDAFFRPAVADDPNADPSARSDEASRLDRRAAERDARDRAEARRAEDRRADERAAERRAQDRRADERAAERRAEEHRAAQRERRADEAADRRADDARRQGDDESTPAKARADRADETDRRAEPDAPRDDESPAGALGLTGLLERLARESKAVELVEFGAAGGEEIAADDFDALDLDALDAMLDDAALDDAAVDIDGLELADLAGELGDDLTRLLDTETPADALARALGGRRGPLDTVRIGGRPAGEGTAFGGPLLLSTPARAAEAAALRAPVRGALPPGVDESSVLRQISDALRLGDQKNRTAEIALHPAELGRIKVRIAMEAGAARIIVGAEHAAVADLLSHNLDQLRRDLMAQGVQVSHLEVQSDDAGQHGERREQRPDDDGEVTEGPEPRPTAPRPRAAARPRGRIDLKA